MTYARKATLALLLLDTLSALVVFNLAAWLRGLPSDSALILAPLATPVALLGFALYLIDGYKPRRDMMSVDYTSEHTIALITATLVTLLITFVFIPEGYPLQSSRSVITASFCLLIPLTLIYRRFIYRRTLARETQHYFIFLGDSVSYKAFGEECKRSGISQKLLYVPMELSTSGTATRASAPPFVDLSSYLRQYGNQIDAVILREFTVDLPESIYDELVRLNFSGVPTFTLEMFHQIYWRKIPLYRLGQSWLFQEGFQIAREPVFVRIKRIYDLLFALSGFLATLPLWLILPILIRLEDGGPVFYRQVRIGKNRRPFSLLKFRSMRSDSEADPYTREGDNRVTRTGYFLRRSRLDELPQLWNVLKGDMSLIGPRAEWVRLVETYEKTIPCYHFRHLVKPGITGWAQVNYPYGDDRQDTQRKLEYDLYYIRHFSFLLDAAIVLKTVHIMLSGKGR